MHHSSGTSGNRVLTEGELREYYEKSKDRTGSSTPYLRVVVPFGQEKPSDSKSESTFLKTAVAVVRIARHPVA